MDNLDREFLDRMGGMVSQLRMLATLHKRADLIAELTQLENRRQSMIKRYAPSGKDSVVPLRTKQ